MWKRLYLNSYRSCRDKEVPADMKHPYYSRIAVSKPLYTETYDSFSFDSNHVLPTLYDTKDKAGIVENGKIRVTRQCYHIELDLDETSLAYTTGDHVGIWPTNDDAEVGNHDLLIFGYS